MDGEVQVIAFYLPQFHPIPENDAWWGPGFTEWTSVAQARKRFPGHYQPRIPGELGFYDLRLAESRTAQATLAREHGVSAFCYWHYWFGNGRRILERPFTEMLKSGAPDFPFCVGWANQTWSGIWHGAPDRVLLEQQYPGVEDERAHFETLLPAFHDRRYFRVDGRPLLYIYDPAGLPDAEGFIDRWQRWALDAGLPGLFIVGQTFHATRSSKAEFDAFAIEPALSRIRKRTVRERAAARLGIPPIRSYKKFSDELKFVVVDSDLSLPVVITDYDNTPRSGARGVVLHGSAPHLFKEQVERAVATLTDSKHRILLVKSWNEWAESNYLEPDRKWGRAYLEALRDGLATRPGLRPRAGVGL